MVCSTHCSRKMRNPLTSTRQVIQRFLRLLCWQLLLTLACALPHAAHASDETVEITRAYIEAAEEGYRLRADYAFELSHGLEDAVQSGVSLHFTTEISFTRPRWYWFDEKAVTAKRTHKLWYDVLTRQYHVKIIGSVAQPFQSLDEALFFIRRPTRWVVAARRAEGGRNVQRVPAHGHGQGLPAQTDPGQRLQQQRVATLVEQENLPVQG